MVFVIIILAIIFTAIFVGVTDKTQLEKYAKMEGWTSYEETGYKWFACSDSDWYHTGFKAVKNGREKEGTVCSGLFFKGATLRMD